MGLKVKSQIPEIMQSFGYLDKDWQVKLTDKDRLEEQTREVLGSSVKVIAVGGDGTMGLQSCSAFPLYRTAPVFPFSSRYPSELQKG